MIFSMTGYAALGEELALGTLSVEIRSVNHRYLDLTFRLPDEIRAFEPGLREMVAARLTRGKVECRVGFQKSGATQVSLQLNTVLLEQLIELDRRVRTHLPGSAPLAASGCPSATAPPFTFTFFASSFSSLISATDCTEKASFNS